MIKLIIFDVGGVIDTFDEKYYIDYISKKVSVNPKEFRKVLIPLLDKMEIGKLELVDMERILSKKFNVSKEKLEWEKAFVKLNTINENIIKLIARLSKKYKIAILTNVSRSRHIMKMEGYLERVAYDKIFSSCYLKMRKPEARIYKFVLKKMNVKASEAVFIDNLKKNTDGAKKVGITSIQFKNYRQLVKSFAKIGIMSK
ncbi:MAG: HAD family phosphatase [Candidatus Micrarchaeaceae archaeon]|jgi:putative hydrolase of the HAD superfamily